MFIYKAISSKNMNNFRIAKVIVVFSSLSYLSVSFLRNYNSPENIEKRCILNIEEYFKLRMYVARSESIKKNNKLSKVDWGSTMSSTKNDISLKKRILKKNQPFHHFLFSNL